MNNLTRHIQETLKKYPASNYLVACSGGVDSVVLFSIVKQLKLPVALVHVNYHLRDEASEQDEQHVRELARSNQVAIHVKSIDLKEQLISGGNLQQMARDVRYAYFEELLQVHPNSFLLLGHHQEDQTETFFLNLARNAGIMGLASMPEKRETFLRPMLGISKEEIIDYAQTHGISWREDDSNKKSTYSRNKLRNEILPKLREIIPTLDASVAILSQQFQLEQHLLETKIKEVVDEILLTKQLSTLIFQGLSEFEKIELCRQIQQPFGILETWNRLERKGSKIELIPNESFPFDHLVFDGNSYAFITTAEISTPQLKIVNCTTLPTVFNKSELFLDASKISGNLLVRRPKIGDRIQPIGMSGSRLVSDVISDAKLTSHEKNKLFLLCDAEGVLWVPELCVSRRAIATNASSKIQKIHLLFE